tara:strand:+ start:1344 stop:2228 length:885 start_codon:yes stop_codon:yes gene_type:complete
MTVNVEEITAKGKHVSWDLGDETKVDKIKLGFAQIILGTGTLARLSPDYNTPKASLKAALDKHFRGRSFLVRPLGGGGRGYAIVREESTNDDVTASLEHGTLFEVTLETSGSMDPDFVEIEENALTVELEESICKEMKRQRGMCSRYMLSKKLVNVVDALHGVCVTGSGGMYSIPDRAIPIWDQVKKVIVDSGSGNKVNGYRVVFDDESCESTLNALTRSMDKEIERIDEMVTDADVDMGKRALNTQANRVQTLMNRLKGYEKMYNMKLTNTTKTLKALQGTVALAAINVLSAD